MIREDRILLDERGQNHGKVSWEEDGVEYNGFRSSMTLGFNYRRPFLRNGIVTLGAKGTVYEELRGSNPEGYDPDLPLDNLTRKSEVRFTRSGFTELNPEHPQFEETAVNIPISESQIEAYLVHTAPLFATTAVKNALETYQHLPRLKTGVYETPY